MNRFSNPSATLNSIKDVHSFLLQSEIRDESINSLLDDCQLVAETNLRVTAKNDSYAVFAKITPIKITPRALYGSTVPSESVNMLTICKSKSQGTELVPNESDLILSAMIPARSLSALLFDKNTDNVKPITFTNLNNKDLEDHVNTFTSEFDHMMLTETHQQIIKYEMDCLEAKIAPFINAPASIKTATIKDIYAATRAISSYAKYKCQSEVEDIVKKMGTKAADFRQEIAATACNSLSNIALPFSKIKKNTSNPSQLESMYRLSNQFYRDSIIAFQNKHGDIIPEEVNVFLSKFSRSTTNDTLISSNVTQGYCTLNEIFGSKNKLFCDDVDRLTSNDHESIHSLSVGFSIATESSAYTSIRFVPSIEALRLNLTNYQLLSLLQSSLSNNWTKTTLSRYAGQLIQQGKGGIHDEQSPQEEYRSKKETFGVVLTEADKAISDAAEELTELVNAGVRANDSKKEFVSIIQRIIALSPKMLSQKKLATKLLSQEISSSIRDDLTKFIGDIEQSHPQVKKEITKIISKF